MFLFPPHGFRKLLAGSVSANMVYMFERFAEGARRVIFFAREEAFAYGSTKIETEHLLLALIREDPQTRKIVEESGAAFIRERVDAAHPQPRRTLATSANISFSHGSKRALSYAAEEAELRAERTIGAPHLLLGLLREQEGKAAQMLAELNVSLEPARRFMTGGAPWIFPSSTPPLSCGPDR